MITVLLVDDYPIMRRLARQILERHSDIHVIGEADTGGGSRRSRQTQTGYCRH